LTTDKSECVTILRELVEDWEDHFDAEGPDYDGGYRWSSSVSLDLIERAKRALKRLDD